MPSIRARQNGTHFDYRRQEPVRSTAYVWPLLLEARKQFEERVGQSIEWDVQAEDWAVPEDPI